MRTITGALLALFLVFAPAAQAQAQQDTGKPTAAQDQYVPVDKPMNAQDTLPAPRLVATAYAFVWIMLLIYVWSIRKRLATVEHEIDTVARRTSTRGGGA
jgi:CcmD family protein